jgi:hypothetical protein
MALCKYAQFRLPYISCLREILNHLGSSHPTIPIVCKYASFYFLYAVNLYSTILSSWRQYLIVPDHENRDHDVVVVRRTIDLGYWELEWGGNGEGLRKGRSVYE